MKDQGGAEGEMGKGECGEDDGSILSFRRGQWGAGLFPTVFHPVYFHLRFETPA